ncbi:carboxypeptidase-like regulatory domain-containing protein [Reichenbachiella versicolor]|uniref:carboxypeptidase-like regulatory domain-containing protein n=1 Tax=Reichenbachiella versicolor TaxID=1821036 RepID=UPI000D6E39DC|nr:carboxypeptidase-like regulatory domain-containing protein [Reichenbachiella versicolor]
MNNSRPLLIYLIVIFYFPVLAQNIPYNVAEKVRLADIEYRNNNFEGAIKLYQSAISKVDSLFDVQIKLARCYQYSGLPDSAIVQYRSVFNSLKENSISDSLLYEFGQALVVSKQYEEAAKWLSKSKDSRAKNYLKTISNLDQINQDSIFTNIVNWRINTSGSDFSPAYFKEGLIWVSNKNSTSSDPNDFDLFYTKDINQEGELERFANNINSKFGEGSAVYSSQGGKLYFTRVEKKNKKLEDGEKIHQLSIFEISDEAGEFKNPIPITLNSDEFSIGHPALSKNGNQLFFASNMPGGFGGTDIYESTYIDDKWSEPKNLGAKVNTSGNESFPFLLNDSTLYLASDGLGGLGGLDIFKVSLGNEIEVSNLGYPINTAYDDFGFITKNNGRSGFFSSNRRGGQGSDDIYKFTYLKVPFFAEVNDQQGNPVPDVKVKINTNYGRDLVSQTDSLGRYEFPVKVGEKYKLILSKKGYQSKQISLNPKDTSEVYETQVLSHEIPVIARKPTDKLEYRVQIGAALEPMDKRDLERRGYKGSLKIEAYQEDNWYKYAIGSFENIEDALRLKSSCNVSDAFIVVFNKNTKVDTEFSMLERIRIENANISSK